jgi:hypothetical protein
MVTPGDRLAYVPSGRPAEELYPVQSVSTEGVRRMACITLTRVTLARSFATMPTLGWEVAYEGQLVATYAEEASGRLRQVGSSRLDAVLRGPTSTWSPVGEYPHLDALREAYLLRASTLEARKTTESSPRD